MLRGILARAPQKFSTVICQLWEAVKKKIFPYCQHLLKRNVNTRSRLLRWFIACSTEDSNCFEPMASLDGVLRYKGHKNKAPTLVQRSLLSAMRFDGAVGVSAPPVCSLPVTFQCSMLSSKTSHEPYYCLVGRQFGFQLFSEECITWS